MKILTIEVPSCDTTGFVPFGVLYAASSVLRHGHEVRIVDMVKERLAYAEIRNIINNFSPDVVGIGGITSGYRNCKELIGNIKNDFRNLPVVVGGIISSIAAILIEKAGADFVVHGEGEIIFPNLIEAIEKKEALDSVKGISFLKGGEVVRTKSEMQIMDLDNIPMPAYELLDMENYIDPVDKWLAEYFAYDKFEYDGIKKRLGRRRTIFQIVTARGCTHRCTFCYRHFQGWRQHSAEYVVDMIRFINSKYGPSVFQIVDELSTANREWVIKFCNILIREKLDIFFIVISSRVDMIDEEMLRLLKEAGCIMINYGYESGSDLILKEIRKGTTRDRALAAALMTRKAGIKNIPEIMVGFPSETEKTVEETIGFLKKLDSWPISVNTPIPFPETPLWEHAVKNRLIDDEEKFILGYKRGLFVNFTKYSDKKLSSLVSKVYYEVELNWLKNRKKYIPYLKCLLKTMLIKVVKPMLPREFFAEMHRWLKILKR